MDRAVMLYTTYPSVVEAEKAGKALVEERLAACVNILPGMVSHYRWQGAVERGEEAVMLDQDAGVAGGAGARRDPGLAFLRHARDPRAAHREAWTRPISPGSWLPRSHRSRRNRGPMNGRQRRRSRRFI